MQAHTQVEIKLKKKADLFLPPEVFFFSPKITYTQHQDLKVKI